MTSPVLKMRITGAAGAYRVFAQVGDEVAEENLGNLPVNFRELLDPLQKSILRTTDGLRSRLSARTRLKTLNRLPLLQSLDHLSPHSEPFPGSIEPTLAVRGAALNFIAGADVTNFIAGADVKTIQEIGTKLFDCLFQQDVYALYRTSLSTAQRTSGAVLTIKLLVEPAELAYIPWETLFDRRGNFHLCCYGTTPFARTATMQDENLHIYDKPPIRILGMIAAPKSFVGTPHELNTDAEQASLKEALRLTSQVRLCWTAAGTYKELTRRLAQGDGGARWDVFLFIGHGLPSHIVLEEDGGSGHELLHANVLKGLLTQPLGPKLVILNSCRGAEVPDGDRFASTAENLVHGGSIAAVVAMQFDISDVMGTEFSPAFFGNLTLGVPLQQAMFLTRLELQRLGFSEWISPVLYMQNKDGVVVRSHPEPVMGS
jgi:hypothetical protein